MKQRIKKHIYFQKKSAFAAGGKVHCLLLFDSGYLTKYHDFLLRRVIVNSFISIMISTILP